MERNNHKINTKFALIDIVCDIKKADNLIMKYFRKPNRMPGYNYSQPGHYFVTICVKDFKCVFGEIINDKMVLNEYGEITNNVWKNIPHHYKNVRIDEYIIMPNHVHGIVEIIDTHVVTEQCSVTTKNVKYTKYGLLSKIIKSFKEYVTKYIHNNFDDHHFSWQRSFYDRIIESNTELENVREYIRKNPENCGK